MCPFKHEVCGTQSEFAFKTAGASLNTAMTFLPSDVCFYTLRSECGVPAFQPQGSGLDVIQILTIDYDDAEVDGTSLNVTTDGKTSTIIIPKKTETFDG